MYIYCRFLTYNFLKSVAPHYDKGEQLVLYLMSNAIIGASASRSYANSAAGSLPLAQLRLPSCCVCPPCRDSGFCATCVSDTCSNGVRVLKTTKQTSPRPITYGEAFRTVVAADGVSGLLLRGLRTKLISNGIQSALFSVLWRLAQDSISR